MKNLSKILVTVVLLLSFLACNSQISNAKTESVKIYGNCGMCESTIEKAGNLKKTAQVDWNQDTKIAIITYDTKKTNLDEILKRIALVGYDSDKFLAPTEVYDNLQGCCQYNRVTKVASKADVVAANHEGHSETTELTVQHQNDSEQSKKTDQLKAVFDIYFEIKEALIKSDAGIASSKSTELLKAINSVMMNKLEIDVHLVYMKVLDGLKEKSQKIAESDEVEIQRNQFVDLSKYIYQLMKASKTETPVYYQFCPMANSGKGANWLSKESAIKNPYYGSKMLTCGKTVEILK